MKTNNASFTLIITIIIDVILIGMKLAASWFANSLALLTDAIHSATDVLARILALFGIIIAKKEESNEYPYGLHKVENLIALLIALFILATGIQLVFSSLQDLLQGAISINYTFSMITIFLAMLSVIISAAMAYFYLKQYKELKSPIIRAIAEDYRSDSIVTSSIFVSLIVSAFELPIVDRIVALLISGILIYNSLQIGIDSIKVLLDINIEPSIVADIEKIVNEHSHIKHLDSRVRRAGSLLFITTTVEISPEYTLKQAETFITEIKREIKENISHIGSLVIIPKPKEPQHLTLALPLAKNEGMSSPLSNHFGKSSYFAIVQNYNTKQKQVQIVENPHQDRTRKKGIKTVEFLVNEGVNILITAFLEEGTGSDHALHSAGIKVIQTDEKILQNALQNFESTQT